MAAGDPRFWIGTDIGLVRPKNEDAFLWLGPEETEDNGYLWVIADGMGASDAGDVASAMLITAFEAMYGEAVDELKNPLAAIERCVQEANTRILHTGQTYPAARGLGTTFVALAYWNGQCWLAHVGDSRCYVWDRSAVRTATVDHVAAVSGAVVSRTEARRNADNPLLTRSVGQPRLVVDFGDARPLPALGTFVLCTDGVWSVVEAEHLRVAMERLEPRDAVEGLVELARTQWSDDNLTVAAIRFDPPDARGGMSREAFVAWARGAALSGNSDATMVLRAVQPQGDERPPRTNVTRVPRVLAAAAPVPTDPRQTALFSADRIKKLVEQATAAATTAPAATSGTTAPAAVVAPQRQATVSFSREQMEAAVRDAKGIATAGGAVESGPSTGPAQRMSRPPLPTDQLGHVGVGAEGAAEFSVDELKQLESKLRANALAGAGTQGFSRAEIAALAQIERAAAPHQGNGSTIQFSANQMQQLIGGARPPAGGATMSWAPHPAPPVATTMPPSSAAVSAAPAGPALAGVGSARVAAGVGGKHRTDPREATSELTPEQIRQALKGIPREGTAVLDRDELDAMIRGPESKRNIGVVIGGIVGAVGLIGGIATLVILGGRAAQPAAEPGSGAQTVESAVAVPTVGSAAAELPVEEPPLLPVPPATPRAPDGTHEVDAMPFYRVSIANGDGRARSVRVDAHEVLASQMSGQRRRLSDMEFVYSTQSAALFEFSECAGVRLDHPDAELRVPVCATPEAAEAYCSAVGRRLPTADEWAAILGESGGLIEQGGTLRRFAPDGRADTVGSDLSGIVGVESGLAEIVRASAEQAERGDLPLLRPAAAGEVQVSPGVVVEAGLLRHLRARDLTINTTPMLGFRCVVDEGARRRAGSRPPHEAARRDPIDRTPRDPVLLPEDAGAEPQRGPRIELMDPVYLPSTIEEYEQQVRERTGSR